MSAPTCIKYDPMAPTPKAWIGYDHLAFERYGQLMIVVCAWCPDKQEADTMAQAMGLPVSHGICMSHMQEQLKLIN